MKPITMYDKVEKIASGLYLRALESSPEKDASFRVLIDVDLDGSTKLLLVFGTTHPSFGDGSCIAVLNPNESLFSKLSLVGACTGLILKEMVQGKCDLTLGLWINTNMGFSTTRTCQYKSKSSPASFPSGGALIMERTMNRP